MIATIITIGILLMILSPYLGSLQQKLFVWNIYKSDTRFSLKRLNQAMINSKDESERNLVLKSQKAYIIYLILFYIELCLIMIAILIQI